MNPIPLVRSTNVRLRVSRVSMSVRAFGVFLNRSQKALTCSGHLAGMSCISPPTRVKPVVKRWPLISSNRS